MKRHVYLLTILFTLQWNNTCPAQVIDSAKIVSGLTRCWRTISHEYSNIYGLEDEDIKRLIKQRVCFYRDSISLFSGVVYEPTYSIKKVNSEIYARDNFDVSKQKLDIFADSVYEVTIKSIVRPTETQGMHTMTDIIAFDNDCIYVVVDGVIFKMFDADKKIEGRSSN